MARPTNTNFLVLAIIGILLLSAATKVVVGQCQGDITAVIVQCAQYVRKNAPKEDPSQACCDAIKGADILCLCQHVPRGLLPLIDMDKVVYVAQFCGKPLPRGTKCGGDKILYRFDSIHPSIFRTSS